VYPPNGRVHITAPRRLDLATIRVYARSKLQWIKKHQAKFKDQPREAPREFINRESHYYNGKRYILEVVEIEATPKVELRHSSLVLYVRPGSTVEKRRSILDEWYRAQLKMVLPELIDKWEKKMDVRVSQFGIKRMKTRWGSCNRQAKRIWLSLELIKKTPECLEYVVVHEMVHFLERKHNSVFFNYMDEYLPRWRFLKDELNRLPGRQEALDSE
jgi:predicted metal-dependent hydrolase